MVLLCGRLSVLVAALAVLLAPAALADSPGADEFPYWPTSVKWSPKPSFKTCSPTDIATPHGAATWDAQFTSCVYTLAYFDTCADDACVDAFSASSKQALNCSYNGKVGTAQEVEANRLQRCAAARKVQDARYVPQPTPGAPQCSSAQLATWDANYNQNSDFAACVKALATTTGRRSCSEACQRLLRDAVSDADECLFSPQAGAVTQHEWLKYLLVWCVDVRGETLRSEPLLFVKGTSAPKPTTPQPTTPEPTTAAPSSDGSDADDAGTTTKPPKTKRPSEASEASSGSQGDNEASAGDLLGSGASQDEESTRNPVASPHAPQSPNYGAPSNGATSRWTVTTAAAWCAVAAATALVVL